MKTDVSAQFKKFAGQEIAVNETEREITIGGEKMKFPEVSFANNQDPVLTAMTEFAKKSGLHMRVWLPGTMGTMDFRMDRVNVNVAKDTDGKWRVGKSFTLG